MTTDASSATPNTYFSYGSIDESPLAPPMPPVRSTPTSSPPPASPTRSATAQGDGISLAAQVGIGVGISVAGICSFVCTAIVCMHLRKKMALQRAAKDLDQESVSSLPWPPTPKLGASEVWGLPKPPPSALSLDKQVELPMGQVLQPSPAPSSFPPNKKASRYELDGHPPSDVISLFEVKGSEDGSRNEFQGERVVYDKDGMGESDIKYTTDAKARPILVFLSFFLSVFFFRYRETVIAV
ncbi:hypothetical protein PG987_012001 [Apiospora arundinis]